jgi:hypothetical protein
LPNNQQERQKFLENIDEDGYSKRRLYSYDEIARIQELLGLIESEESSGGSNLYQYNRDLALHFQSLKDYSIAIRYFTDAHEQVLRNGTPEERVESFINLGYAYECDSNILTNV